MLDLQLVRRGNPTVDLSYFLGSSTSPEMREEHLEDLLGYYHKNLISYLVDLGHKDNVYIYSQFRKDFNKMFVFGIALGSMHASVRIIKCQCISECINILCSHSFPASIRIIQSNLTWTTVPI
jgi:hypothetical protein